MDKIERFQTIVNEMVNLYAKKNANYGDSFGKLYADLGPIAGLVPLHNKLDRITNLVKGGTNNFESLEDSFKDLACYAIMNLIEMQGKESEKLHEVGIETDKRIKLDDGSSFTIDPNYKSITSNPFGSCTVLLGDQFSNVKLDPGVLYFKNQPVEDDNVKNYFASKITFISDGEIKPKENK